MKTQRMKSRLALAINALLLLGIALLAYHDGTRDASGREEPELDRGSEFIRGDANDDGDFDISDAVRMLGYLFLGEDAPPCLASADTNDDAELAITDAILALNYLFIGGSPPSAPFPEPGEDPTPDLGCRSAPLDPVPAPGSLGGPDRPLSLAESLSWQRGREIFDRPTKVAEGLGPVFNGDSCRGCHLDPVLGGAGGSDVDVVRFAFVDEAGVVSPLPGGPAASRLSIHGTVRDEAHPDANVVETRQTPSLFGLGLVDRLPEASLLALADPDDLDDDGISGRARILDDGRVGRFGHKCGVPRLRDFVADAAANELGLTTPAAMSPFSLAEDTDDAADPELSGETLEDFVFFCEHLAAPARTLPADPVALQRVRDGEILFGTLGCTSCHVASIEGAEGPVRAYSDFLLHDIADPARHQVDEPGVDPREFRTAPLWGVRDTAPYLHDGSAETLHEAVLKGHFGEADLARQRYQALSLDARSKIVEFLESL